MKLANVLDGAKAHLRAIVNSRHIETIRLYSSLRTASHVAVLVTRNEVARIPYLLDYYRRRGIGHFIVIDNMSTDDTRAVLEREADVSIFMATGAFKSARFGMDWVNTVLRRHCCGKWILHVDADEFLVFPHDDERTIRELTDEMACNGQISLQCLLIDMYSRRPVRENVYRPGEDPLSVCPLYDRWGYASLDDPRTGTVWIKGGVRGRLFFPDDVWSGPALNKTPLVLWRRHYAFLKSAHEVWPPQVNRGGAEGTRRMRGALLHFKFLADISAKLREEAVRRQHTAEYDAYGAIAADDDGPEFAGSVTATFDDWRSLARDGLIGEAGIVPPPAPVTSGAIAYASLGEAVSRT